MLPPVTLPVADTTPPVVKLPPVTLPVATINPAVPKLPTFALPVTVKVLLVFRVPVIFTPVLVITTSGVAPPAAVSDILPLAVTVMLLLPFCNRPLLIVVMLPVVIIAVVAPILPTFALPVTLNLPAVVKLPPDTLPVATINPAVPKLPTFALPVTLNAPVVVKLPPDTLPVAVIRPAVPKLPTLALPVTVNLPPVEILPPVILPLAVRYPDKLIFATLEIFAGKSTHNVCELDVILVSCAPLLSRPILSVLVCTCTHAMFAVTITLPVGELTVIPAPGVLLTEATDAPSTPAYTSVKFCCTLVNAVLIASACGSSGNVPKSIFL